MRPTIPDKDIPGADPDQLIYCFDPWVKRIAKRYSDILKKLSSVDIEDLIQAGRLALLTAQKKYDPEAGAFLGFSKYFIMSAMRKEIGINNQTGALPPIPVSLDAPAYKDEDAEISLGDTIADESSETAQEHAERTEQAEELHRAIKRIKSERQQEIISRVYFQEQERREAAADMHMGYANFTTNERKALSILRRDVILRDLCAPSFSGSVGAFRNNWASAVEQEILWMEKHIDEAFGDGTYMAR